MTAVDLVYCFALVVIPVHWMPGDQPLPHKPTQLIMDVDSPPLGLGLYPITSGFSMFTPWMKGPFVQGLWCQIFSPGQTIFVCRFVYLAAWCKRLHNCVNLAPQCAHANVLAAFSRSVIKKACSLWIRLVIGWYSSSSSSGVKCPRNVNAHYPHLIDNYFLVEIPRNQRDMLQFHLCIWNFMCGKIFLCHLPVILRLFFLWASLCSTKQQKTQRLLLKASKAYKPFLVQSHSNKHPSPTCTGWLSKRTLIWTDI